jgi:phage terminase small subunit
MGRPRKPTNILQLKGAFKANPSRRRARDSEPVPKAGIGPAPDYLSEAEKQAWDYLVGIVPNGVLFDSDRVHLEMTSRLMAEFRSGEMKTDRIRLLSTMVGKIGLNPSDRSKVLVPEGKAKNPFASL